MQLAPGDSLVELGSGSGYGAALAAYVVGADGRVVTVEIDAVLAAWAERNLARERNVMVVHGDAMTSAPLWGEVRKIIVTFAVDELPGSWLDALPETGGCPPTVHDPEGIPHGVNSVAGPPAPGRGEETD